MYRRLVLSGCIFGVLGCGDSTAGQPMLTDGGMDTGGGESPDGAGPDGSPARRIFITSAGYTGNLGGVAGADAACHAAADGARLGGTWRSFLSTSQIDAIDRIADVGPWYDVQRSTLLFGAKSELPQNPRANITEDEAGHAADYVSIWTATRSGTYYPPSCQDWTSAAPDLNGVFGEDGSAANAILWSLGGIGAQAEHTCDGELHLLCIEQ